jgi:hypothetical protein
VTAVSTSTDPEHTIGILGVEVYDANRTTLNSLAFRTWGQFFAYWPDSTSSSRDKANVRDGHYVIWSPTIWITAVDGTGAPTNPRVEYLLDAILEKPMSPAPMPAFEPLDSVIKVGLVPDCAMKVNRTYDGGDLSLYDPAEPCGCYFESKANMMPNPGCTACTSDTECGAGKCRLGFCEAH